MRLAASPSGCVEDDESESILHPCQPKWLWSGITHPLENQTRESIQVLAPSAAQVSEISIDSSGVSCLQCPAQLASSGAPKPLGQTPDAHAPQPQWVCEAKPIAEPGTLRHQDSEVLAPGDFLPPAQGFPNPTNGNLKVSSLGSGQTNSIQSLCKAWKQNKSYVPIESSPINKRGTLLVDRAGRSCARCLFTRLFYASCFSGVVVALGTLAKVGHTLCLCSLFMCLFAYLLSLFLPQTGLPFTCRGSPLQRKKQTLRVSLITRFFSDTVFFGMCFRL